MDLWADISLGRIWIDDDRYIHEEVKAQQEVMLTTTSNLPINKKEFLKAMSEAFDRVMKLNDLINKHGT